MIQKCVKEDFERIISYIGADYPSCLYLYMNLKKYGIGSDTIDVFVQQNEEKIYAIMLKYYSCLHVYSKDTFFDAKELASFFIEKELTMLYCTTQIARMIYSVFPESIALKSRITTGWVSRIVKIDKSPTGMAVLANENDYDQIARLIYNDEYIGRSYKYEELRKQLIERNNEGYARNLVIKKDDVVIAHACTNAEVDNLAVVAELLVRKEYRKKGYASEIWRDICNRLLSEGKEVYSFYYSTESRVLHKHLGFFEVCEWAKVVIV